jgi:hypothetical protein
MPPIGLRVPAMIMGNRSWGGNDNGFGSDNGFGFGGGGFVSGGFVSSGFVSGNKQPVQETKNLIRWPTFNFV